MSRSYFCLATSVLRQMWFGLLVCSLLFREMRPAKKPHYFNRVCQSWCQNHRNNTVRHRQGKCFCHCCCDTKGPGNSVNPQQGTILLVQMCDVRDVNWKFPLGAMDAIGQAKTPWFIRTYLLTFQQNKRVDRQCGPSGILNLLGIFWVWPRQATILDLHPATSSPCLNPRPQKSVVARRTCQTLAFTGCIILLAMFLLWLGIFHARE